MSDVEIMVNKNADVRSHARMRIAAKKRERRLKNMLLCSGLFAVAAIGAVALGAVGAIHALLAAVVSVFSTMAGCFTFGLYVASVGRK
jgi:hypothetical protein